MVRVVVILNLVCWLISNQAVAIEPLRVGINPYNKPLEFETSKGEPAGVLVDFWRYWENQSGYEVEFAVIAEKNGATLLREGKIDVLANAPPGEDFDLSPHYLSFDYSLFTLKKNRPEVPEHFPPRTGIRTRDMRYIEPDKLKNLQIQQYSDHSELMNALEEGHIDYLLANTSQLTLAINNNRLMQLRFPNKIYHEHLVRAAIRNNDPHLLEKVTAGLASIDATRTIRIKNKWMPSTVGYRIFWPFIGFALFILLAAILMTTVWMMNQRLKQQVWLTTRELSDQANTDPLTKLINRRHLMDILKELLEKPMPKNRLGILLYLDLDNFKPVNDRLGHDAGDFVLQVIAERLRNMLREQDYVARLGGDEFALLLIDDSSKNLDSEAVARRIEENVAAPIMVKHHKIQIRCSIGITDLEAGDHPQEVLNRADKAMYSVKFVRRRKNTTTWQSLFEVNRL